jgi:HK97 family phage prohead protease
VLAQARAGIVTGASFGFRVPQGGDAWPARDKRELIRVDLLEISAVTVPAYADTSISARAIAHAAGRLDAAARLRSLRLVEL